ncbi:heparinase II/III family protein [Spiribacter roseus]|uniref:Alginate lyase family protein n=1 Tax=Spiribacter roseus TaxID=1855875 RepID=A0ABV3RYL7_9GAMM
MTGRFRFRLLNVERALQEVMDWDNPSIEALWRYHLHYFDDLNAEGAEQRVGWHRELLQRWLEENPPGDGIGWDPYPTSLRIVNWVKWGLRGLRSGNERKTGEATELGSDPAKTEVGNGGALAGSNAIIPGNLEDSLAVQARWLRRRLEHHLLGNHLLANAKALIFAGCFFEGGEADRWRRRGEQLLRRELDEQILPDGGHFERSPMYHSIVLEDLLDLINLDRAYPECINAELLKSIRARLPAMLEFLAGVCHPDGEIAFFNDAAMGMAPMPAKIFDYARRLGVEWTESRDPIRYWSDSGLVRLEINDAVLLMDVGPVGPDYLPGHAHADSLSLELSLFGQRVLVNSGTSVYGKGPQRHAERSTAAHNTVEINGENSSEVWGGFRVARRARVHDVEVGETAGGELFVEAWHDGYTRLPGQPVHHRRVVLGSHRLLITDRVTGRYERAVGYFHLHPAVELDSGTDRHATLRVAGQAVVQEATPSGSISVMSDHWHPEFGVSQRSSAFRLGFDATGQATFSLVW